MFLAFIIFSVSLMSQRSIPDYFQKRKEPSFSRKAQHDARQRVDTGVDATSGNVSVRVDVDGDGKADVEISPIMRESFEMEHEPMARTPRTRSVVRQSNVATGSMWVRRRRSVYRRPYTVYARPRGYIRTRRYRNKFLRRPQV